MEPKIELLVACEFFARWGNVVNDPNELMRQRPTIEQLKVAKNQALAKGQPSVLTMMHFETLRKHWNI